MAAASNCSSQSEKVPNSEESSFPVNLGIGSSWLPYIGTTVDDGWTMALPIVGKSGKLVGTYE